MRKILIIILMTGLLLTSGCVKSNNITNTSEQGSNAFFFKSNITQSNYKGIFSFDSLDEDIEKDVKLNIRKVDNLKYGILYELKIEPIIDVPNDRLNLGYFYVLKDKIYKIEPTKENLKNLKTSRDIPKNSIIVSQDKEIKDTFSENQSGWHQYIKLNGNKCEYHSYNNQISTGYYESFVWEKDKGLISYESGYGAESNSIKLQRNNN